MGCRHSVGTDQSKEVRGGDKLVQMESHAESRLPHILTITEHIDVSVRVLEVNMDADVLWIKIDALKLEVCFCSLQELFGKAKSARKIDWLLLFNGVIEHLGNLIVLSIENSGDDLVLTNVRESIVEGFPLGVIIFDLIDEVFFDSENPEKGAQ